MGRLLAVFIWVMTILSVAMFFNPRWWFPPAITEHGPAYDQQFLITIIVVGLAFTAAQVALGYAVWRFRDTGDGARAVYSHGNNRLEMIWTAITAFIFIGLGLLGQRVWAQLHLNSAPADAAQVHVLAQQFAWNFHYPGPDKQFGRTDPTKYSDSSPPYGAIGLDRADPAAKDDTVISALVLRVNQTVELTLRGRDVTHSFWVPELRFKQDLVPGMDIRVHFKPVQTGHYRLACAELCGALHYNMKSDLLVLPEAEYDELMQMPQTEFQKRVEALLKEYPVHKYAD
jgi:cytochrome c oxidase subunit 2